jgi:hypothetical protein
MSSQTVYTCSQPFEPTGECLGTSVAITVDSDLGQALNNHALALQANVDAMNEFFTLSSADVGMISALMLATFITGNAVGKVVSIMRKA